MKTGNMRRQGSTQCASGQRSAQLKIQLEIRKYMCARIEPTRSWSKALVKRSVSLQMKNWMENKNAQQEDRTQVLEVNAR